MKDQNAQEISFEIAGLKLAGKVWGPEKGLKILGFHGWLDNAATYDLLAPLLEDVRLISIDLPGHGFSEHRAAHANYSFVNWIPDVFAIADILQWQHFSIIGHSMGAGIAAIAAGTFPSRVQKVVLIEGLGPLSASAKEAPGRLAAHITRDTELRDSSTKQYSDFQTVVERLMAATKMSLKSAEILARRGTTAINENIAWKADKRLRATSPLRLTEEQVRAFMQRIECPILAIRAINGYPYPVEQFEGRRSFVRNLEIHQLAGGHHIHLDNPERVAQVINPFLKT